MPRRSIPLAATLLLLAFAAVLLSWSGIRIIASIQFDRNCEGYLKRAADANAIPRAIEETGKALAYIEGHDFTSGFTSILYNTPDEDIGFWYQNLKDAHTEMTELDLEKSTPLEKSNMLMKLRETLLDSGDHGDSVTSPDGISIFPYNKLAGYGALIALIGIVVCFFWGAATRRL